MKKIVVLMAIAALAVAVFGMGKAPESCPACKEAGEKCAKCSLQAKSACKAGAEKSEACSLKAEAKSECTGGVCPLKK